MGTLTNDQYETDGLGNVVLHNLNGWQNAYFQSFNGPQLTQITSATGSNAPRSGSDGVGHTSNFRLQA
jgi:hypothetical protein